MIDFEKLQASDFFLRLRFLSNVLIPRFILFAIFSRLISTLKKGVGAYNKVSTSRIIIARNELKATRRGIQYA